MRKPRDIDAELKALEDKAAALRLKKITQLGELVSATGADALDVETLAGVLIDAVESAAADPDQKEAWRRRGDGFFRQGAKQQRGTRPGRSGKRSGLGASPPASDPARPADGNPESDPTLFSRDTPR
jgi:hypothetical protein